MYRMDAIITAIVITLILSFAWYGTAQKVRYNHSEMKKVVVKNMLRDAGLEHRSDRSYQLELHVLER